jgi:hypothetical protein
MVKGDAYSFATQVDQLIETLDSPTYLRRRDRGKVLQEELYPISRLALRLKQPGLEVEVEAFEDDGPADGRIRVSGFWEGEFDVQVTCDYDYAESLRRELLASAGVAPGAGEIFRDKKAGAIRTTVAAVDHDEHIDRIAKSVLALFKKKAAMAYGPNTILIIAIDEVKLSGLYNWHLLLLALQQQEGMPGARFSRIYLFNGATNELQQVA